MNFISVRTTNFDAEEGQAVTSVTDVSSATLLEGKLENGAVFVSEEITKSDRPDLGEAKIVVSGGRGKLTPKLTTRAYERREFLAS